MSNAPPTSLEQSYTHCARLARRAAKNFYYSFLALPRPKRRAMCALYAFLRTTDDIGDGPGSVQQRRAALQQWRSSLTDALQGHYDHPALPALHDVVTRYNVDPRYLYAALDGVAMDLRPVRYETFDELIDYCYHVASVVGLACIAIWGFRGEQAKHYAHQCGIAFQLTNILRDLKEDAQLGRVYLPQEELDRFDYPAEHLRAAQFNGPFRELMEFQVDRAAGYYQRGAALIDCLEPAGRPVFRTMHGIYSGILSEIRRSDYDVFTRRVSLKPWRKIAILLRSFFPHPSAPVSRMLP